MTKILNFFGGPGAGKSTLTAHVFALCKYKGIKCDVAWEWIKEVVWDKSFHLMDDQISVFAEQRRRIFRLAKNEDIDLVITDSPLLLTTVYHDNHTSEAFKALVKEEHDTYPSLNFFVTRQKKYWTGGRNVNEERAKDLDQRIGSMLVNLAVPHYTVDGGPDSPEIVMDIVRKELKGVLLF